MTLHFDKDGLRQRLTRLSAPKQLAFMLLLCERMFPGLERFAFDTDRDPSACKECLKRGWMYLAGLVPEDGFQELGNACQENAPDTEDFLHPLTSAAGDAALSIANLAFFLSNHDVEQIVEAAGLARDSVDLFLQRAYAPHPFHLDAKIIDKHPLMQRELERQDDDLSLLQSQPDKIHPEVVEVLKLRAANRSGLLPVFP